MLRKLVLGLFIGTLLSFAACQVEDDPCYDTICYQGDCVDGSCVCWPGMEGKYCSQEIRWRFLGKYQGVFVLFGDSTEAEIYLESDQKDRMRMTYNEYYLEVVDTSYFVMPEQNPLGAQNTYSVSGSGYVQNRQLTFHIILQYPDTNYVTTFYGTRY